jgi:hypothetical protein
LLARGRFHDAVQEFDAGVALFTAVPVDAEAAGLVLPIRGSIRAWEGEAYAALGEFGPASPRRPRPSESLYRTRFL